MHSVCSTTEVWKPVLGWAGFYEVSDQGRIRSLDRVVRSRGGTRVIPGRVLKPAKMNNPKQYLFVGLSSLSKDRAENRSVHRTVLEAFVGPCPEGMEGCHGPGGPHDNRLTNLRWGTHVENEADKVDHGTLLRGERVAQAKLTEESVRQIRELHAAGGRSYPSLAFQFGVTTMTICRLVLRQSWSHVP